MSRIRFIGDVHGKFDRYKKIIKDCDYSIQLGDMGVGFIQYGGDRHGSFLANPPFDSMSLGNNTFIRGNHDCCDYVTECLTDRGWIYYHEIKDDDKILSLNKDRNAVWTGINEIKVFPYCGAMIRLESLRFSMKVTPNHRIITSLKGKLEFISAKDINRDFLVPVAGKNDNHDYPISDSEVSLIGWLLTDGGLNSKTHNHISIYQNKPQGQQIIEKLLSDLKLTYTKVVRKRIHTHVEGKELKSFLPETYYRLTAESSRRISQWVTLTLKSDRELPQWACHLSSRQFAILLEAIVGGDGCWDGVDPSRKSCAVIYGPKKLLSSVQIAAVLNGWRARLAIDNRGDYRLCLTKRTDLYITKENAKTVPYKGFVWCLSVPHENFMVRRKGCAYFTGNSPSVCKRHKFFIKDGTVIDNMMFVGGAVSIDRPYRIPNYSWWPDEEPSLNELNQIVDTYLVAKPEIMATHECPSSISEILLAHCGHRKFDDGSRCKQAFQSMFEMHKPKLHIFGHYHYSFDQGIDGTRFICLNELEWIDVDTETFEILNKGQG